jgi:hypothetical protein
MFENERPSKVAQFLNRGPVTRFSMGQFCLLWNVVIALQITAFILLSSEISRLLGATRTAEEMTRLLNPTYYFATATLWTFIGCRQWFLLRRELWAAPTPTAEAASSLPP